MAGEKFIVIICVFIGAAVANNVHEMQVDVDKSEPSKLTRFVATNCSIPISNRLIYFEKLEMSPDPIKFGSTEIVNVLLRILQDLPKAGSKLSAHLELFGRVDGQWMDYCPLIGREYCEVDDFCQAVKRIPECPLQFIGLEKLGCACPFLKNTYGKAKAVPVKIPQISIGISGTFNLTLTFIEDGQPVGCTSTVFCLNSCS